MSKGSIYLAVSGFDSSDMRILKKSLQDSHIEISKSGEDIDFWFESGDVLKSDEDFLFKCIEHRKEIGFSVWFNHNEDCFVNFDFGAIDIIKFLFDGLSETQEAKIVTVANEFISVMPRNRGLFSFLDRNGGMQEDFYNMIM